MRPVRRVPGGAGRVRRGEEVRPRVLAIVLHGFGPYYLDPLLERGRMPNLKAILDEEEPGYRD